MSTAKKRNAHRASSARRGREFSLVWKIIVTVCLVATCGAVIFYVIDLRSGGTENVPLVASQSAAPTESKAPGADPTPSPEPNPTLADPEQPDLEYTSHQWPGEQYPDIAIFPSDSYDVILENLRADIYLPTGSDASFAEYIKTLTEGGANTYIQSDHLTVLNKGDVEIQLASDEDAPMISLCAEPSVEWEDESADEYVLPETGRLVLAEEGADDQSTVLTYRCASYSDMMDYLDLLRREGWVTTDSATPTGGTFFVKYQRGERTIIVDYYANSSNYEIHLGTQSAG